ncbi:MAG: DMT family transporter [Longimicrobiales bacterium]
MSRRAPADRSPVGMAEAFAAACLWGSSGVFAVHLFRLGVPPETVALVRPLIGAAILVVGFLLARPALLRLPARALLVVGVGGGAAVGVFQVAYQMSVDASGVPTTVALLYLAPALVAAAAGPLLGEWPSPRQIALIAVTLVGVWLTILGAQPVEPTFAAANLGWGVLAGVAYAAYTLFGRYATPRFGSVPTVVYSTLGACALLSVVLPASTGGMVLPSSGRAWLLLAVFGALTIAGAQFLFFDALGRVEASTASVVTAAEPIAAALLSTLLLDQGLSPLGWVGIAFVVAGVAGVGLTAAPRGS